MLVLHRLSLFKPKIFLNNHKLHSFGKIYSIATKIQLTQQRANYDLQRDHNYIRSLKLSKIFVQVDQMSHPVRGKISWMPITLQCLLHTTLPNYELHFDLYPNNFLSFLCQIFVTFRCAFDSSVIGWEVAKTTKLLGFLFLRKCY